ncbi:unnamed protein product, partial [Meganyctiphanes norvegica]
FQSVSSTVAPGSSGNISSPIETQHLLGVRHGCHASLHDGEFGCVEEVYQDQHSWKTSKAAIDDEIRRLRQQLFLLKDLRKHLHEKRPNIDESDYDEYDLEEELDLLGLGEKVYEDLDEDYVNPGSVEEPSNFDHDMKQTDELGVEVVEGSVDTDKDTDITSVTSITHTSVPAVTHLKANSTELSRDIHGGAFDLSYEDYHSSEDVPSTTETEVTTQTFNLQDVLDNKTPEDFTGLEEDIRETEHKHTVSDLSSRRHQKKKKFEGFGIESKRDKGRIHEILSVNTGQSSKVPVRNKYIYPVAGLSKGAPHPIENETTRPICWCNKRMAMKLALHQEREQKRAERLKLKEERMRRREHKQKKRDKKVTLSECNFTKLNCYTHDNDHWRTPPLWRDGSFCFCMNAANNTYWCLRTINETENLMYCEFITGLVTYYDLNIDPYQLRNVAFTLSNTRLAELHEQLERLRTCSGADHCDNLETVHEQHSLHNQVGKASQLK